MDTPKSLYKLVQENIFLQDLLAREKLQKAKELFVNRLVFTAIIFLIIFIILCVQLEYASRGVRWLCFILFFGVALFAFGFICLSYSREQDDARKAINSLKELLWQKRYDHYPPPL